MREMSEGRPVRRDSWFASGFLNRFWATDEEEKTGQTRLSFGSERRILVLGNCCVVPDFGGAHQWAQAHFLVCAPFGTPQQPDNLLVSWDLRSIRCARLWSEWPPAVG